MSFQPVDFGEHYYDPAARYYTTHEGSSYTGPYPYELPDGQDGSSVYTGLIVVDRETRASANVDVTRWRTWSSITAVQTGIGTLVRGTLRYGDQETRFIADMPAIHGYEPHDLAALIGATELGHLIRPQE